MADILGHNKENLTMDVYHRPEVEDFVQPLSVVIQCSFVLGRDDTTISLTLMM